MNLISVLVITAIAILFIVAIRYLLKNGVCSACSDAKNCKGRSEGCGGGCSGCSHSGACHPK